MSIRFYNLSMAIIAALILPAYGQVKRGRNEGTFNIPASNVIGNGNITIGSFFSAGVASSGGRFDPGAYLTVGITDIMQLSAKTALTNFRTLGCSEGRFQLTMPGNDNLRFFGIAISADIYLSTETDTLSGAASPGRPDYHAYIRPSIIADLDWIAKFKKAPVKTYLLIGMADDPDLLYRYSQLSICLGSELKMSANSYFIDFGAGFYKELPNERLRFVGDPSFAQQLFWIEPGFRYRLRDRIGFLGAFRVYILQRIKSQRSLRPRYLMASTALEIPLFFKETNTEAIRTMIFVHQNKKYADSLNTFSVSGKSIETGLNPELKKLGIEFNEDESQEEELKRREEIQKKMDEIEKILEELE